MADNKYKLKFAMSDGSTQEVEFTAPQGEQGPSGVHVGSDEPTDPNVMVWIDPQGDLLTADDVVDRVLAELPMAEGVLF